MLKKTVILKDLEGIHARNSAKVVMICRETGTCVSLEYGGRKADGGNILEIMALNARCGDEITITARGVREKEAMEEIEKVLTSSTI